MKSKAFSLRLLVTLIAWLTLLMPTAKLKADNSTPLCFTAQSAGATVTFNLRSGFTETIQTSRTNNGTDWATYNSGTAITLTNVGDKVYFRAANGHSQAYGSGTLPSSKFAITGNVGASGNIMSLYGPTCPNGQLPSHAFDCLFENCSTLLSAPELPATELAVSCYRKMFYGCSALTSAPELPATTMQTCCYQVMFMGCSSLAAAPALPSTSLASYCYAGMFANCTSIKAAPELPASTLFSYCYDVMFSGCTALTSIPEITATNCPEYCCYQMYSGCSALQVNTSSPGKTWKFRINTSQYVTVGTNAISNMFSGTSGSMNGTPTLGTTYYVASDPQFKPLCFTARDGSVTVSFLIKNVTFTIQYSTDNINWNTYYNLSDVVLDENESVYFRAQDNQHLTAATPFGGYSDSYISRFVFSSTDGGTVEGSGNIMSLYGPDCNNFQLPPYAFANMFENCTLLTTAPDLPATTLGQSCYTKMFKGCSSLTTAPALPATILTNDCYNNMFRLCTALTNAPALPANSLADHCYYAMFAECSSLTTPPALPATTLADYCYGDMFLECSSLNSAPALPATTMTDYCYSYMFDDCVSLMAAPSLPATNLDEGCYTHMFNGCTQLNTAPALPATILNSQCYSGMFLGCTSLTKAPVLPATSLASNCYIAMFGNCTSLTKAPALPATTLALGCYENMFAGCSSLTTIPELPALTLYNNCYESMFANCTSLKINTNGPGKSWKIPHGATSANESLYQMFIGTGGYFTGEPVIGTTYYIASDPEYTPLNFTARNGSVNIRFKKKINNEIIQYSFDNNSWSTYADSSLIALNSNEKVYFRASNNSTTNTALPFGFGEDFNSSRFYFSSPNGGTVEASGNIMSLYGPDCPNIQLPQCAFSYLFYNCDLLTTAPILSATTLGVYCYKSMFQRCTSLVEAPSLPATTMELYCYMDMFMGCSSLITPPQLPATNLAEFCYYEMFYNCTSINTMPSLPATTLSNNCYEFMFKGCSSLTNVMPLPATTLATQCYRFMFGDCVSIVEAPALNATELADACYADMFSGCTSLITPPSLPATTLSGACYLDMFSSCTSLHTAPILAAVSMARNCYMGMFRSCTSLTSAPVLPATTLAEGCYNSMFYNCTSLTEAPALPATTMYDNCYSYMFKGCTSLVEAPNLHATSVAEWSYSNMFEGCSSLTEAPMLPATTLAKYCYSSMFANCTSLIAAPELSSIDIRDYCYLGMFSGCTSLIEVPKLPAINLAEGCYYSMFSGCTSLKTISTLPATTLYNVCYKNMFKDCSSLTINTNQPGKAWQISVIDTANNALNNMFTGTDGNMNSTPTVNTTYYIASDPSYNTPLSFTAKTINSGVRFYLRSGFDNSYTDANGTHTLIQYKTVINGDTSAWSDNHSGNTYSIVLPNIGDKVFFRAANEHNQGFATEGYIYSTFNFSGSIEASGNIMSLYGPNLPYKDTVPSYAFSYLFTSAPEYATPNSALCSAPLLPATKLSSYCYNNMFDCCISLTEAPDLPATTLGRRCYSEMFHGCTALVSVPSILPATDLTNSSECYEAMFEGCIGITKAPVLPATRMSSSCYARMFSGCTSLTEAPELPATELSGECYAYMFSGCPITEAPNLPATTVDARCYAYMFNGCPITKAPNLPATTMALECYEGMFSGCKFTTPPELPATTLADHCYDNMFSGCTSLTTTPELPATVLALQCYSYMFGGCTSLTTPPILPATNLAYGCYYGMFFNCAALTSMPELPATTLADNCYEEMFSGCTSLLINASAPGKEWSIPAGATSSTYWNDRMFYGTGGNFTSDPEIGTTYYIASGSTKTTSGDGDWNDPTKWPNGKIPGGADTVTISSNMTIPEGVNAHCESLTIANGGVLTVAPSATLHATTITNTDPEKFIIQADSASTGTVRFTSGSPKVTVQMCLKGSYDEGTNGNLIPDWQYRGFIGTPDASQTLRDIVIYKWDETNNNVNCWGNSVFYNGFNNKTATGTFTPWDGFSVANFDTAKAIRSYTTTLLPTNVDHTYNLTKTITGNGHQDAQNCGLNLLTNSYSAPINMSAGVSGTNIQSTFYFFNTRTNSEYNSDKSAAITTYPTASGSYLQATSPYIAAGQSFAVKATADGASLTIPATAVSTVSSGAMYAPAKRPGMVKITVESEEAIDELYLLQMDECTSGFDNGFDGTKMFSTKAHQIYAQNEYGQTAVNADRTLLGQFVGFKPVSGATSDVTLRVSALDIDGYDELYLYDYVTDTYIEITDEESSYTFTSTGEETPRRFQIVGKSSDGTEYNPKAEPRIEVVGEEIYLMNFERGDAMVILTDAAGRTLWSVNAKEGNTFTLPHLAAGVYFVSCGKTTAKYVQH